MWRCDNVDVPTRSPFPGPHRWQSKQGHIGPAASTQNPEPNRSRQGPQYSSAGRILGRYHLVQTGHSKLLFGRAPCPPGRAAYRVCYCANTGR